MFLRISPIHWIHAAMYRPTSMIKKKGGESTRREMEMQDCNLEHDGVVLVVAVGWKEGALRWIGC